MRHRCDNLRSCSRAFTLIELLVTITIISILASLTLAGLGVARQRAKADRTETTIRKIHEVVMPHYEKFANRSVPKPSLDTSTGSATLDTIARKGIDLIAKRRMMALELPDGWRDLRQETDSNSAVPKWTPTTYQSGVSRRFFEAFTVPQIASFGQTFGDAECLWLSVMQGGYADPGIIGHFREDEFGDRDDDGQREFIDGWGRPIRFLRWAPGFVSRYQPAATAGVASHDAFDLAGIDPLATLTLFPLIYSMGPNGEPDIANRDQTALANFSYPQVGYDPFFTARQRPSGQTDTYHLAFAIRGAGSPALLGKYIINPQAVVPLGTFDDGSGTLVSDDVHNHSMSR